MAKLSTHETEVKYATSFTVMSSGDVIIWGEGPKGIFKKMFGNPRAFYVYNKSGGKWKRVQILEPLCRHLKPYLLPVKIKGKEEQLAVSCVDCKAIRLYNLKTGKSSVVFRHEDYRPRENVPRGARENLRACRNGRCGTVGAGAGLHQGR